MQIRTSQTLPKKYNIFSRIDQLATYGTKSTIWTTAKYWRLAYAMYIGAYLELWQVFDYDLHLKSKCVIEYF